MAIAKFLEDLLKQCTDVFFGQGENPRENQACARRVERLRVRPGGGGEKRAQEHPGGIRPERQRQATNSDRFTHANRPPPNKGEPLVRSCGRRKQEGSILDDQPSRRRSNTHCVPSWRTPSAAEEQECQDVAEICFLPLSHLLLSCSRAGNCEQLP